MPKFLAGCHYNGEEISRHLKKNIGYWPVQMNGNKFATGQTPKKPVEIVKGADFSWVEPQKSPEPWVGPLLSSIMRMLGGASNCMCVREEPIKASYLERHSRMLDSFVEHPPAFVVTR